MKVDVLVAVGGIAVDVELGVDVGECVCGELIGCVNPISPKQAMLIVKARTSGINCFLLATIIVS